ncbi:RpiB/LacA/LacB family sugar-phosphate isomerase [Candidatus Saccharibacteria bacterium]|nr:RpiB/LacA/LacB family sugar-phosphate isomerase [Candidatus Saccharibacteria bacterium]
MGEVFIASDHRGYSAKNRLVSELNDSYTVSDLGPFEENPDDDYNDAAIAVARAVKSYGADARGIIICGSSHGVAIQANRFKGVRAISGFTPELAKLGREHNDANVLCLSADFTDEDGLVNIARTFLETDFSGEERHARRVKRLDEEV